MDRRLQEREMAEGSYNQFCPVAMAAEILCTRWTIVLLRELVAGSTRFNELRRGVPRMSPALLSKRLKDLETAGVVARSQVSGDSGGLRVPADRRRKRSRAGRRGGGRLGAEMGDDPVIP
jgi:DNA-binding HxlR family transcriptional regulator